MATVNKSGVFTIEVSNLDNVISLLRRYPEISTVYVEECLSKSTITAQREIRLQAPVDRNRLRNSILIKRDGRYAYTVGTNVKYAWWVENGTKPHRAPWKPIDAWAKRRGIPTFPVWYKIMKNGTRANPFFQTGVDDAEPLIQRYFAECESNIVRAMNGGTNG